MTLSFISMLFPAFLFPPIFCVVLVGARPLGLELPHTHVVNSLTVLLFLKFVPAMKVSWRDIEISVLNWVHPLWWKMWLDSRGIDFYTFAVNVCCQYDDCDFAVLQSVIKIALQFDILRNINGNVKRGLWAKRRFAFCIRCARPKAVWKANVDLVNSECIICANIVHSHLNKSIVQSTHEAQPKKMNASSNWMSK